MQTLLLAVYAVTSLLAGTPSSDRNAGFTDKTAGMQFVFVPGGCFQMGDSFGDGESDEKPLHEVCVDGFNIGKYTVTVEQFRAFVKATGYRTDAENGGGCFTLDSSSHWTQQSSACWKNPGFSQTNTDPAVCVSWNDAAEFATWLSRKSGRIYRLPTEAEWEYAARAGTTRRNFWGDSPVEACKYANVRDRSATDIRLPKRTEHDCSDGYAFTAPVGSFRPNPFGLYDMMGNVWQWTADWYDENYYSRSPRNNPQGPLTGSRRVPRGGSWRSSAEHVRASLRVHPPSSQTAGVGFRLVCPSAN